MKNLVIGSTTQLAHYFPEDYEKISGRNVDLEHYKDRFYDRVLLCFAEQRTFIENDESIFYDVNVKYTLGLVDFFVDKCDKLIVYSTSELWNNCDGTIDLDTPINFNKSYYILSKYDMTIKLKQLREKDQRYKSTIILYPFNFNSVYRKSGFLFGKIFDSILNKKKIEIGDTYFYRDLVHPKHVVERSILAQSDEIIGSGRLVFVNDFIRDLYEKNDMDYEKYVKENVDHNLNVKRKMYYLKANKILYKKLLEDTLNDIREIKDKTS